MKIAQRRPLGAADTVAPPFGCRHSNPDICKNNLTDGKCVFVRSHNICLLPPRSWGRIFRELQGGGTSQRMHSS